MAAVHKLTPDLYEDYFDLIALHSSLEDFALAYALNLNLRSNFRRRWKDLEISDTITVPVFEWKDEINDRYWTFFTNKGKGEKTVSKKGLFKEEPSYPKYHMVAEHREVDYFLKIEKDGSADYRLAEVEKTISSLLAIPKIITAYSVATQKLKSRNNLIF
jgi:protease II